MKKILTTICLFLMLTSCAIYTIGEGKANINPPQKVSEPETRLRIINERKAQAEAERIAEEERKAEEARQKAEAEAEALRIYLENAVYEYPEDISELVIPHNYRPQRTHLSLDTEKNPLRILFLPLDSGADLEKVASSVRDLEVDFTFITGSLEQRVELSKLMGKDTVILEDGAVLYNTRLKRMEKDYAIFTLDDNKDIQVGMLDTYQGLPSSEEEMDKWILSRTGDEAKLSKLKLADDEILFAFSSSEPDGEDWNIFTYYPYRRDYVFKNAEMIRNYGFDDVYRQTHFSAEADPGITRMNGDVYERMDFLYAKDLVPVESSVFNVAGMDSKAIYAEVMMP